MSSIPTYSLLEPHEDLVTYRIPDTVRETPAWLRIGLFSWELEGVPIGEHLGDNPTQEEIDRVVEQADGTGLHIDFHPPTRFHPQPSNYRNRVEDVHDVFSRGSGQFRIQNADPASLRQTARWIALYAFTYWWWVEEQTNYQMGVHGTQEQNTAPRIRSVSEDGVITVDEQNTCDSPYTLSDIELLSPEEWESPYENSIDAIQLVVSDLLEEYSETTVRKACREVSNNITSTVEKTEERKQEDELKNALLDGDGIGRQTRWKIAREFDSLTELCEDIRNGSNRLRSLPAIGESREQEIIDALIKSGAWEPHEDASKSDRK